MGIEQFLMADTPNREDRILFEHPLNERIRTLLRLEFLFAQGRFGLEGDSEWHSRTAIHALVDLVSLLSRGDLRSEIQKELERLTTTLERLQERPGVDGRRLEPVLQDCRSVSERLREAPPGIPGFVKDNEFLGAIIQRSGILGGTCAFDLPGYHLWLQAPPAERRTHLERWFSGFQILGEGTRLILRLLRDSADPVTERAPGGGYQGTLDRATPYQMLRVSLPRGAICFPEISGSKHFCTIRFLEQPEAGERPRQVETDVEFILERCVV